MRMLARTLLVLLLIGAFPAEKVSAVDRADATRGLPATATRDQVVARFGYPGEILLVGRQGPFFEPSEIWSYYTTNPRGLVRERTIVFSRGRVHGVAAFETDEVVLRPDTPEAIEKILAFKAKQRGSSR